MAIKYFFVEYCFRTGRSVFIFTGPVKTTLQETSASIMSVHSTCKMIDPSDFSEKFFGNKLLTAEEMIHFTRENDRMKKSGCAKLETERRSKNTLDGLEAR